MNNIYINIRLKGGDKPKYRLLYVLNYTLTVIKL